MIKMALYDNKNSSQILCEKSDLFPVLGALQEPIKGCSPQLHRRAIIKELFGLFNGFVIDLLNGIHFNESLDA